jgi:Uncharacterised protein family (UPF0175)
LAVCWALLSWSRLLGPFYTVAMTVSLDLPDTLASIDPHYLRGALVALLYHTGKLSERQACEALGMTRRAFEEWLPRFGLSILIDSQDNLEAELSA